MSDEGRLDVIERAREIPLRLAEGILEGLASKPGDMIVLGMGFYAGYMGFDLMEYMMRPFKEFGKVLGSASIGLPIKAADLAFDVANMPIEIGAGLGGAISDIGAAVGIGDLIPGKRITPATKGQITTPGISYYGPPPTGYSGEWPPYGITLAQIKGEIDKAPSATDKAKWTFEYWWAETNLKLVCGCLSAIGAYAVTRPGFVPGVLSGIGEITKGIGEITPF